MANSLITSGFTDFPISYTGAGGKFVRVASTADGLVFAGADLSDINKVEVSGAYLPTNGQALVYNAVADRWRPSTLDVYSAGNGINKSGLTLNVTAGAGGGLVSNTSGVFIADIANVAGTYGSETEIPVITVNSKGQITSVTVQQANVQSAHALTADYVSRIEGTPGEITVVGGTGNASNAVINLTSTGITAGWYGNVRPNGQYVIPTLDIDTYGRVRQIVEIPIAFDGNGNVIPSANITSYSVFRVAGQTSIIADQPEDTVTFIAGNGVTITTNAANDSITFSADVSSALANMSISAFSDVGSLVGIQGGQALLWSNVTNRLEYGNVSSGNSTIISSDTVPDAPVDGALWYDQVSGRLYIHYSGTWVDAAPAGGGVNLLAVNSNILPSANAVYSLGNATLQWKDLWVSGNTIHLGNVAVGMTGAGKMTVAGSTLATESFVGSAVANVSVDLTGYATETYVNNAIANVSVDLTGYATETYVNNAIANVSVDLTGYATETFVNNQIDTQTLKLSTDIYQDVTSSGTISLYTLNPNGGYGPSLNFANTASFSNIGLSNVLWNSVDVTSSAIFMTFDWNNNILPNGKVQWQFTPNGSITFPDGTVQTTAYTGGGGATYNQSLNTTDTVNFANVNVTPGGMLMSDVIEDYSGAGLTIQAWRNSRADYVFNGRDARGDAEILLPSRTYIRNVTGDGGGFVDIESYKSITNKTDDSFSQGATYLEPYSFVIDIDHAATTGPRSTWRFDTDGITFPDGYIQTTAYRRNETVKFQNFGSGVEVLDCGVVNGYATIFRYANLTGNLTANLTNLNFDGTSRAMSVNLIITQGATPYVCNAVQIEGVAQTVLWQGSASAPTGNANKTDIITFSIVRTGLNSTDYIVFGQLVSFG